MGGNLFKLGRVDRERYLEILTSLKPVLDKNFGDAYRIPTPYRNKKDYGDVDILVDAGILINRPNWKDELMADLGVTKVHPTGAVFSMDYMNFQVDVFLVGTSKLESAYNFMSYNILGNLIGRIYHKFNLRYGEQGLYYILRGFNNHISKEILVSRNMKDILTFVDLSYDRWKEGFDDLEDIFKYILTSKYFCANSYDPTYFTIEKRASERPDFKTFLDYLIDNNIEKNYQFDRNKEIYISEIDEFFKTDIRGKYEKHLKDQEIAEQVSKKFNGKIVMDLLNITGKELGGFIGVYKNFYGDKFEEYILNNTQESINENIVLLYQNTL